MSIELRTIRGYEYVTRTYRASDGVRKIHLGSVRSPNAQFLYRTHRLKKSEKRFAARRLGGELKRYCEISQLMKLLEAASRAWPTLDRFSHERVFEGIQVNDEPPDVAKLLLDLEKLPEPYRIAELCRLSDEGTHSARVIVNRLFRQVDGLSRSLFNVTKVAREKVVSELAGESYVVRQAIEEQMDQKIAELTHKTGPPKSPLHEMYSEILTVAWLNALRCTLAVSRRNAKAADQKKLETNADRACRRFSKLANNYEKLK